ncbi:hypothetical protein [Gracilinema caldarium]|uniref:hypothetical protein n=1 Tax=Gracilinema caldarium TaxID=215591 RepID=UPI0026EC5B58|nr:hypothetical protein [Gracilinema caldarium]
MKKRWGAGSIFGLLVLILAVLGETSCTTVPAVSPELKSHPFAELPPGATLYVYGNVQKSRSLLKELYRLDAGGVSGGLLKKVPLSALDITDQFYGAIYRENPERNWYALVSGRFPVFQSNLSLFFSPEWKKKRSGGLSYWRSEKQRVSLQISSRQLILTDGIPQTAASLGSSLYGTEGETDSLLQDMALSHLVILIPKPQSLFQSALAGLGIPAQNLQIPMEEIRVKLYSSAIQDSYEIQLNLQTGSPIYARALGALLSLASRMLSTWEMGVAAEDPSLALQQFAGILLSGSQKTEGNRIILVSKPVSQGELALLLHNLLVYFERNKTF